MRRSFRYRLYPTKAMQASLLLLLDAGRLLYNCAILQRRWAYRDRGATLGYLDQAKELKDARTDHPLLGKLGYSACQEILRRVQKGYESFFRRLRTGETPGYPRFQGRDRFDSLVFPTCGDGCSFDGRRLYVLNVGRIKVRLHRKIEGTIKTVTVKRSAGKWNVIFSCEGVPGALYHPCPDREVALDMGLENFASSGAVDASEEIVPENVSFRDEPNPRWYRKTEERLIRAQRALSRKLQGSNRRSKAKHRLSRLACHAAAQRNDFQKKLAQKTVSRYAAITVEDLDIGRMVEKNSGGMRKSILDAGWGRFLAHLACKAEEAGRRFVKVPPQGTSQECSRCHHKVQKALSERMHRCSCGLALARDHNSTVNLLRLGRSLQCQ